MTNAEACARYKARHPERVRQKLKRAYHARKERFPEHNAWRAMIDRCNNRPDYAGRGITVCTRWRRSFANFLADMGPRPSPRHSIDRYPDNDGDYTPSNCRWATASQQQRNTRQNHILRIDGRSQSLRAWADESGIKYDVIRIRLRDGWSAKRAVFTPIGPRGRQKGGKPYREFENVTGA